MAQCLTLIRRTGGGAQRKDGVENPATWSDRQAEFLKVLVNSGNVARSISFAANASAYFSRPKPLSEHAISLIRNYSLRAKWARRPYSPCSIEHSTPAAQNTFELHNLSWLSGQ
jgi:hypothetical protein